MAVSNFVESIELIDIDFGTADTTSSGYLTKSQNYQNCVPFMTTHSAHDNLDSKLFDMYFSGTTTSGVINFERAATRTSTATVKCYVVEFNSDQIDVQQGAFSLPATTGTDNVSLSTTLSGLDKTAMTFSWKADSTSVTVSNFTVRGKFTSVSGIEFYRGQTLGECSGHWFAFEDKGSNFSVTHLDDNYTAAFGTAAIDAPYCIDPNRTFILGSTACSYNSSYANYTTATIALGSDGCIRSEKDGTLGTTFWAAQIIEFLDTTKVYTPLNLSFQEVTTGVGTSPYDINFFPTCNTATTTPVVASMQGMGRSPNANQIANANFFWAYEVTATGTLRVEFQDDNPVAITSPYITAVDWAGITPTSGTNNNVIPQGSGEGQSFVKSVENISVSMTTEDELNVYLSKGQNWQNCVLFVSCRANNTYEYNLRDHLVSVYFTDAGVLHIKRPPNTQDRVVEISVVEFWPDQVKVQQKRIFTNNNTTTTVPIDTVSSIDKCFITNTIYPSEAIYLTRDVMPRVNFATTSGVDIYIYSNSTSSYQIDVPFFVVEDLGSNFTVGHYTNNFLSSSLDSYHSSTEHYPVDSTLPLMSYTNDTNTSWPTRTFCAAHYDYSHKPVTAQKYDASTGQMYWHGQAIKFLDNKSHVHKDFIVYSTAIDSQTGTIPSKFLPNIDSVSCINITQGSTFAVSSTTLAQGQGFNTVKMIDTVSGIYEVSRVATTNYAASGGVAIVDWIGYYPSVSGTNVKTRSMIQSVQNDYFTSSYYDSSITVPLTKGQNLYKCVPFVTNNCTFTSTYYYMSSFYKTVYRGGGGFVVDFPSPLDHEQRVSNREVNIDIIEFNDSVNVQYGTTSSADLSTTVTISSVDLDRAFLVFYASVDGHDTNGNRNITVCGRFSSSNELTFIRGYNTGNMSISWYVVECTDESDYWTVQHNYNTSLGSSSPLNVPLEKQADIGRSMFLSSWAMSNSSSSYVYRSVYKARHSYDDNAVFTKTDASYYDMDHCNVEVIEFNSNLTAKGLKIFGVENEIISGLSEDVVFNTVSGSSIDTLRSIAWNMNVNNESQISTNNINAWQSTFMTHKLKDGDTITLTRGYSSYTTNSYTFVGQFPEYNKYYMEGYVKIEGEAPSVEIEVAAFRKEGNTLVDTSTSVSGTGYFWLETPYEGEHYVVAFDSETGDVYNDLIYGQITPTVISGCFAYNEGLTTTSGYDIGVPLGRQ